MCSVVENVRSIETVLNQILDIVPENFSKKPELRVRLNYVIDDSKYRSPELMCIAWQDATLVLRDILIPEALSSKTWCWADDVFELFSEGKWGSSVNKEKIIVS